MALTRARAIAGPPEMRARVEKAVRAALVKPRDRAKIAADLIEMRERVFKEKGSADIWELKQTRGGLVDVEFLAQYLQLIHAAEPSRKSSTRTRSRPIASCAMPACWRPSTPTC